MGEVRQLATVLQAFCIEAHFHILFFFVFFSVSFIGPAVSGTHWSEVNWPAGMVATASSDGP